MANTKSLYATLIAFTLLFSSHSAWAQDFTGVSQETAFILNSFMFLI